MLPSKLQSGQQFKTSVVSKVNEIIDYLKSQRIIGDNKTIRVNQLTSGVGISAISQAGSRGGGGGGFTFPFQLSIVTPTEEEGGGVFLSIKEGRIQFTSTKQERCYVSFFDEEKIDLSSLSEPNTYAVMLFVNYRFNGDGDADNPFSDPAIVFVPADTAKTTLIPSTRGIYSIILGYIELAKEENSSATVWKVVSSDIVGNLVIDITKLNGYFSIIANINNVEHGQIYEGYELSDLSFTIREGKAIFKDETWTIPEEYPEITENSLLYLTLDEATGTFEYTVETEEKPFIDEETNLKYFEIGQVIFTEVGGVDIWQSHEGILTLLGDTYKIKVCEDDAEADFIKEKITIQEPADPEKNPLSGYPKQLVSIDYVEEEQDESSNISGTVYKMVPIWTWKEINDYDKSLNQCITHDKGNLKWTSIQYELSGSLENWMEIDDVSGKNLLYWKPEFAASNMFDEQCYLMASVKTKKTGDLAETAVLSGLSWSTQEETKDGLLYWDLEKGMPNIKVPPSNTTEVNDQKVSSWVLVGNKEDGLNWVQYETSNFSLSGSLLNHFEIVPGTSGNVLRWKDEYDEGRLEANFILTQDYEGKFTKATWLREDNEKHAIMCWDFEGDYPDIAINVPPEAIEGVSSWVLAGNTEEGLSWQPYGSGGEIGVSGSLANIIEVAEQDDGTKALQVISEYDGSVDQFSFLILDETGCIDYFSFYEGGGAVAGVMCWDYENREPYISTPPEAAEDDFYFLEGTKEDGLGWTSFSTAAETVISNVLSGIFDEAFTSEDNSIVITQYEGETLNVDFAINPEYFNSSDGSISIEDYGEGGGLDFKVNAAVNMESSNNSILITPPAEDAEEKIYDLVINPDYFESSDESILIQDAGEGDGLDFTVPDLGKIKISEEDTLGFLPSKLVVDESAAGLIQLVPEGNVLKIKSALQGSGIMILNDGKVSTLAAPEGKAVLVCNGGTFAWVEYGDCENACN
jgi:hypothetical protein